MNEFMGAIGSAIFALSGLYIFAIDNFRPNEMEIANKRASEKGEGPHIADSNARKQKRRERSVFFVLWSAGMIVTALGMAGV